jgi:hypothetical protein
MASKPLQTRSGLMSQLGSNSDLTAQKSNFRSTPESRLKSDISPCPKSANCRRQTALLRRLLSIRRLSFSFFSWVALFVDAGLTQFVPHCSEGSVDRRWWAALADNDF